VSLGPRFDYWLVYEKTFVARDQNPLNKSKWSWRD